MLANILTIVIGWIGGVAVGIQTPLAGSISQRLGGASSSVIIHLGGLLVSVFLLAARGGEGIRQWRTLPWYMLLSGAFGLVLILTVAHTLPRVGAAMVIALIIVGQLMAGVLIDHFGLFGVPIRPITVTRLFAVGLLLAGGYLIGR